MSRWDVDNLTAEGFLKGSESFENKKKKLCVSSVS